MIEDRSSFNVVVKDVVCVKCKGKFTIIFEDMTSSHRLKSGVSKGGKQDGKIF